MRQPHSWMEYRYRFASANNDNYKMWIRDEFRIYQIANGSYFAAFNTEPFDGYFNTFEEAKTVIDNFENDN